jgi:uncharacterized protein (DUF1499 family)
MDLMTFLKMSSIICCVSMLFMGCAGKRPGDLGIIAGRLQPCPDSPNCVSSQSADEEHKIDPLALESSPSEALARLKEIILEMKRTSIIEETDNYLYAEFKSAALGFVDDVEFYVDTENKVIHVRSASRIGYSDLGVNRKRIEAIRLEFEEG